MSERSVLSSKNIACGVVKSAPVSASAPVSTSVGVTTLTSGVGEVVVCEVVVVVVVDVHHAMTTVVRTKTHIRNECLRTFDCIKNSHR